MGSSIIADDGTDSNDSSTICYITHFLQQTFRTLTEKSEVDTEENSCFLSLLDALLYMLAQRNRAIFYLVLLLLVVLVLGSFTTTGSSNSGSSSNKGGATAFRAWIVHNMKNLRKRPPAATLFTTTSSSSEGSSESNGDSNINSPNENKKNGIIPAQARQLVDPIRESLQWWDDLAPPFALKDDDHDDEDDHHEDDELDYHHDDKFDEDDSSSHHHEEDSVVQRGGLEKNLLQKFFSSKEQQQGKMADAARPMSSSASTTSSTSSRSSSPASRTTPPPPPLDVLHFCFLVHGHRGFSQDLSYMQTVMQRTSNARIRLERRKQRKRQRQRQRRRLSTRPATTTTNEQQSQEEDDASTINRVDSSSSTESTVSTTTTSTSSTTTIPSSLTRKSGVQNKKRSWNNHQDNVNNGNDDNDDDTAINDDDFMHQDMVVHAVVCNERKTDDGVAAGGERLVQEIISVISHEVEKKRHGRQHLQQQHHENHDQDELQEITISFVGNSLGGLYSRYAVAKLVEQCQKEQRRDTDTDETGNDTGDDDCCFILNGHYRLHLNIFCTTATPHLGVAGHTFLPIPRSAEIGVAHAMGTTGKDLFRVNDLIHRMATCKSFLQPLSCFSKRIAYANAYGTDFPVPAQTAAFLNQDSSYPHYFDTPPPSKENATGEESPSMMSENGLTSSLIIATLHTPRQWDNKINLVNDDEDDDINDTTDSWTAEAAKTYVEIDPKDDQEAHELAVMSASLDSLGWQKSFVDARRLMPKIPIPKASLDAATNAGRAATSALSRFAFSSSSSSSFDEDQPGIESIEHGKLNITSAPPSETTTTTATSPDKKNINATIATGGARVDATIARLRKIGRVVESKDVAEAVLGPALLDEDFFHWPLGHNMMVAFSRNRLSTYMNKAGRPVVDSLAKQLVQDIFDWKPPAKRRSRTTSAANMANKDEATTTTATAK